MYFVYILRSAKDGTYYTGVTENVEKRVIEHNSGSNKYSSSKGPFLLVWHCGFENKEIAYRFEKYLKSGSGIAFRNKRLLK